MLVITACGGGGGSDVAMSNASTSTPSSCTTPSTVGAAASGGVVTISGTVKAQIPSNNTTTGALNYSASTCQVMRNIVVQVINVATATALATGTTDANGSYSLVAPAGTNVFVRVRAEMQSTTPSYSVAVRDNTSSNALYVLDSSNFNTGNNHQVINLAADSGWGGSSYTGTRASAPFALLNTVYLAFEKIKTVSPNFTAPLLNIFWSVNNVPSGSTPSIGEIGTSHFTVSGTNYSIYIVGKENVDTDEYDETVVAHEFGHYMQAAFSRDNSIGGSHTLGDKLDMRVAFSEGWGNAWSGIATARSVYSDSLGANQGAGFAFNLNTGASTSGRGWFSEASNHYIIWKLHEANGFASIWGALTNTNFINGNPVSTTHSFVNALDSTGRTGIAPFLSSQNITVNDEWGAGETNSGGLNTNGTLIGINGALPIYKAYTVGNTTSYCVSGANGTQNKLGNWQFIRFTVPTTKTYTVTLTGGTDPDFGIYQARNTYWGLSTASGIETRSVTLSAGEAVISVSDDALVSGSANTPCLSLLIQ